MLPTSTVENYLKRIYLSQRQLPADGLVPMGQLAAALGVAPGTATAMVKALSESGLVRYEPYTGVRLLPAGEKLAAMVLRRHRLVELFLVEVMGMSWAEVHEDAEALEHVVSDRLIERIDQMLGHPQVDPHGDPIPDPQGKLREQEFQTLLTCPLNTTVTVTRVADQNAEFLRFVEDNNLKPGQQIEVEARDPVADRVRVRGKGDERVTIGTRAASKLLVQAARVVLALLVLAPAAWAQAQPPPAPPEPFAIVDNSFLVEEAFNQEPGIFQNIVTLVRSEGGAWEAAFTQEWPVGGQEHQFSYTIPFSRVDGSGGINDVFINYRYQALVEGPGRPAFSPRLSVIIPSGDEDRGRGSGVVGWQVNLPFSKQLDDIYLHWNAGFTLLPGVEPFALPGEEEALTTPHLSGSAIWRMRPLLNLMIEAVAEFEEGLEAGGTTRTTVITLAPGLRVARNAGDAQLVFGFAVPVSWADDETTGAVFGYFSYELPFRN